MMRIDPRPIILALSAIRTSRALAEMPTPARGAGVGSVSDVTLTGQANAAFA
jgi:hypothetical protein